MSRPLTTFALIVGLLLPALALSAPLAWASLVVHLAFSAAIVAAATVAAWAGRAERARLWGLWYLLATLLWVAGLDVGARARGQGLGYWAGPYLICGLWAWAPPLAAGIAGGLGGWRRRRGALHRRRAA